ncbi:hypothetical protein HPP92_016455 [Vanilla planifolia]|uniref:Uncharacterized protein n=1 Tax=Vanilla planifolia TaxID=51239 RepID=A0A835QFP6_VANPL|nr:hypothetical protein HPP92_016455 [Vanilla planifolia]
MFEAEIKGMKDFVDEWSEKISTVILRGFDARCRDYLRNKKQWQEKGEEARGVLTAFIGALSYLQEKISKIEAELNEIDFVRVWRNLASGVDNLFFTGLFASNTKFSDAGVERLRECEAVEDGEAMEGGFSEGEGEVAEGEWH